MYHEEINIYVQVKRKRKLTELYPQRAILEESRKESSLIQANDWIDHNYYENLVDTMEEREKNIYKKYGPKPPEPKQTKRVTPRYKVPEI